MGRENKKDAITKLHREEIMKSAEKMFAEKGFAQTTIADISKASEYSRRTIYAYYERKEDILHHIILKGLLVLKQNIENIMKDNSGFLQRYYCICDAMAQYHNDYPHSLNSVNQADTNKMDFNHLSSTVKNIFSLGEEINDLIARFIEQGKESGDVRKDVSVMPTVYLLWANISSLLSLVQTKETFLSKSLDISETDFLEYGYKQIINSILEERI